MNFLKRIIFKIFGVKSYLKIVSQLFFKAYSWGFLKGKRNFYCHYIVRKFVHEGDYVIDLGANLGYYSYIFSKLVGKSGKVHSIEPVGLFRDVLSRNLRKRTNVEIIPYAIGETDNEKIKMGVPVTSAYFSHGRTHVLTEEENCSMTFDATVMRPDSIFKNLSKLNYIKCDIEGYEGIAIPLFREILIKFKPVLQIEIDSKNKAGLFTFLKSLGYLAYEVNGEKLFSIAGPEVPTYSDVIFIDKNQTARYNEFISI